MLPRTGRIPPPMSNDGDEEARHHGLSDLSTAARSGTSALHPCPTGLDQMCAPVAPSYFARPMFPLKRSAPPVVRVADLAEQVDVSLRIDGEAGQMPPSRIPRPRCNYRPSLRASRGSRCSCRGKLMGPQPSRCRPCSFQPGDVAARGTSAHRGTPAPAGYSFAQTGAPDAPAYFATAAGRRDQPALRRIRRLVVGVSAHGDIAVRVGDTAPIETAPRPGPMMPRPERRTVGAGELGDAAVGSSPPSQLRCQSRPVVGPCERVLPAGSAAAVRSERPMGAQDLRPYRGARAGVRPANGSVAR